MDTINCSKSLLWNADVFLFMFLLYNDTDIFLLLKKHRSVSNEVITGGKWVSVCLRG